MLWKVYDMIHVSTLRFVPSASPTHCPRVQAPRLHEALRMCGADYDMDLELIQNAILCFKFYEMKQRND